MNRPSALNALRAAAFAIPVVAVLLACSGSTGGKATVSCAGAGSSISCDVTQTEGSSALEACWDMQLTCANGVVGSGSGFCQLTSPDSTVQKSIPLSEFSGLGGCDNVTSMEILNQTATVP